jgi:hypothetical protein
MKKTLLLILLTSLLVVNKGFSIAYVSAGSGPANWNVATSWTPNGIPTQNDDVTISVGHTININASALICRNITIAGTLNWTTNNPLTVRGTNYTVSGTESGFGSVLFNASTVNINGSGTFGQGIGYSFNTNATIAANTTINKSASNVVIGINKTLTNLGSLTLNLFTYRVGSIFINSTNATLTVLRSGFMLGETFSAHATGNTVNLQYSTGAIPTTTAGYYNLTIAGTVAGAKTLPANTTVLNNLTINPTNTLNTNNFDLSVGKNFTNNGTFTATTGKTVNFNGSTAQGISTTGTLTFTGLTINNAAGVSLTSGTYNLSEVLTISNGNFNTNGRRFTMLSTASRTARIAPVAATGSISGNFTVERFITARDTTWSILASPVQGTTVQDWDDELFIHYSSDPLQATVLSYDESIADYVPVSASSTTVDPMQGFEVYLTADFTYTSISNITANAVGVPNFGDQSVPVSFTNGTGFEGQNLVGNPFASSISWSSVFSASSNIDNFADVFDFTTGNYANVNLGDEIGSGQGFWVYALNGSADLNIPESAKTTSSNSTYRSVSTPLFNLNLASADGSHTLAHKLELTSSSSFENSKDANDRSYRTSPNKKAPKITAVVDGKDYVRNAFSSNNNNYDLPLSVQVGIEGKYVINASNIDMVSNDYSCVTLEDKKLNQVIDLNSTTAYSFFASPNDSKDRFQLHFAKDGNCKTMSSTIASAIENQVQILPTMNGNSIAFNFAETLNTTVTVTNMLGQSIVEGFAIQANTQTIELGIPSDFSGMYIIKIENEKGVVTKKFVKK